MGSVQFWGLGSGLSNTGDIIDAMVMSETMKIKGYEAKITLNDGKKNAWGEIKASIEKMNDIIKNISGVGKQNFKTGTTSSDGYFSATVGGSAIDLDYMIEVKQLATSHAVSANKVSDIKEALGMEGSFKINGVQIDINADDSVTSIMDKINNTKDSNGNKTGAKAYIIDGVMVIESEKTGVENTLKFEDKDGILSNLGIFNADGKMNTTKTAQDAVVVINDITVTRPSNNISDAIDGVTLNLTKVTKEPVKLSVANDTTEVKKFITDFVGAYNDLMSQLDKLTSYDQSSGSSGLLNGDSSISTIKNTLSKAMQSSFSDGAFSYLFDIGISVDKYGKYQIDEKKLDDALSKDPSEVINMFTKGLDNPTSESGSETGILVDMKNAINGLIGGSENIFTAKTKSLEAQIKSYNNLIDRQKAYIEKRKKSLEAQFAALEQTMNSINNTSGMLTNMSNSMNSKE